MSTLKTNTIQHLTSGFNNVVQFVDGAGTQNGTLCRAWVNFNGTGTVAIRASFNVSSITDNNTGDYTVNFSNALSDANYCVQGFTERNYSTENGTIINQNSQTALTTTAARICSFRVSVGAVDLAQMFVAIFR